MRARPRIAPTHFESHDIDTTTVLVEHRPGIPARDRAARSIIDFLVTIRRTGRPRRAERRIRRGRTSVDRTGTTESARPHQPGRRWFSTDPSVVCRANWLVVCKLTGSKMSISNRRHDNRSVRPFLRFDRNRDSPPPAGQFGPRVHHAIRTRYNEAHQTRSVTPNRNGPRGRV